MRPRMIEFFEGWAALAGTWMVCAYTRDEALRRYYAASPIPNGCLSGLVGHAGWQPSTWPPLRLSAVAAGRTTRCSVSSPRWG